MHTKISAPDIISTPARVPPISARKVSCPVLARPKPQPELKLLKAAIEEDTNDEELLCDFNSSESGTCEKVKTSIEKTNSAGLFVKVTNKPKLLTATEKAKTTEADVKKELKRGSMKDKWGLSLTYQIEGSKISLKGNKCV